MAIMERLAGLWRPYGGHHVFPSAYTLAETIERLRLALVPEAWPGRGGCEGCVGEVSGKRVSLAWQHPYARNSFAPRFTGRLSETSGGVRLSGTFAMSAVVKGFFVFILLFFLIFFGSAVSMTVDHSDFNPAHMSLILGGGILFLLLVTAFVLVGQSMGRQDMQLIRSFIEQRLAAPKSGG